MLINKQLYINIKQRQSKREGIGEVFSIYLLEMITNHNINRDLIVILNNFGQ